MGPSALRNREGAMKIPICHRRLITRSVGKPRIAGSQGLGFHVGFGIAKVWRHRRLPDRVLAFDLPQRGGRGLTIKPSG